MAGKCGGGDMLWWKHAVARTCGGGEMRWRGNAVVGNANKAKLHNKLEAET